MEKGEGGFPVGGEVAGEAEVDAGYGAVEDVGVEVVYAHGNDSGLAGEEEGEDGACFPEDKENAENAKAYAYGNAIEKALPASFLKAGTGVLGGGGGDGGHHGRGDEEEEADDFFHDAYGSGCFHAAAVGNGGDDEEGDLDEAVLAGNGNADTQDLADPFLSRPEVFQGQVEGGKFDAEEEKGQQDAQPFAGEGAQAAPAAPIW